MTITHNIKISAKQEMMVTKYIKAKFCY